MPCAVGGACTDRPLDAGLFCRSATKPTISGRPCGLARHSGRKLFIAFVKIFFDEVVFLDDWFTMKPEDKVKRAVRVC